eukprot:NODE_41_length_29768_cov_0.533924.p4 type:complete len:444 gc:universal NODE_41_length_29768_cov_0.533924:4653-5984(+)
MQSNSSTSPLSPTVDALTEVSTKSMKRFSSQLNLTSPNEVQTKQGLNKIDQEFLKSEFVIEYLDVNQVFTCSYNDSANTGRIVVTPKILGYMGNDLNSITKISIQLHDIINIEKRNTSSVFPNAIRIYTTQNHYTFVSFLKRNAAFKLILSCWENACLEHASSRNENIIHIANLSADHDAHRAISASADFPSAIDQNESNTNVSTSSEFIDPVAVESGTMQSKLLGFDNNQSLDQLESQQPIIKKEPSEQDVYVDPVPSANSDPLTSANDQVKAFWSNMGKSLISIQAQITEKTKPKARAPSSNSLSSTLAATTNKLLDPLMSLSEPQSTSATVKPPPLPPSLKSLTTPLRPILVQSIKLKCKYVYRFLFESPLLQRTLQQQGATDLEITHWYDANYSNNGTTVRRNARTISYKISRPSDMYKYTDVHYLINSDEGQMYRILI